MGNRYEDFAYCAHPLREIPNLSVSTWTQVSRASGALGRLNQGAQLVRNPGLLRQPTLRREAQSTSALEGTYAPLEEVLAASAMEDNFRSAALEEVLNYVDAAENGFRWLEDGRPITVGLLEGLHKRLVQGTSADTDDAGRIRRIQVVIGSRGSHVSDARFIPMPEGPALEAATRDLAEWINQSKDVADPVVAAALAHYQFETLHPFNDGNGRIGRLLIVMQFVVAGVLEDGLLSVSPWFEKRRDLYQDLLAEVSETGQWDGWVKFFAQGIEASAIDTADRLRALMTLREEYQELLKENSARGVIRDIVDYLLEIPYVTIPLISDRMDITYQAASNVVKRLEELGVLEKVPRVDTGVMLFKAPRVVSIITAPASS